MPDITPPDENKGKSQSPHINEEIRAKELVDLTMRPGGKHIDDGVFSAPRAHGVPKAVKWAAAGLIVLFVAGFGVSYYVARRALVTAVSAKVDLLQQGVADLQNFDFNGAEQQFSSANGAPDGLSGAFGSIAALLSGGSNAVSAFGDLSARLALLTQDLSNAENDAWTAVAGATITNGNAATVTVQSAPTSSLVTDLSDIRDELTAINGDAGELSGVASSLGGKAQDSSGSGSGYLALTTQLSGAENFLNAFIPWFSSATTTHHVLVLFENPSEMRPGGGFIGSYADVAVSNGAITAISVHDVADADAAFPGKIVPPVPLQLEEKGFLPADGNWFFDFPTSASETIALFQQAEPTTTFDAAIAVTPQTVSDILSVVGSVDVASTTFTSGNVVQQIQNVVQAGQAAKSAQAKSIVGALWGSVLAKLASSTPTQRQDLLALALNWVANKDVTAYFKNAAIENFITAYGASGAEYQFPQNFNGDYLAVANTDVNSDKSELYVSSTVSLDVELGADGTSTDHLVVTRTHNGDMAPTGDWWYRTTNQDWMQIFVPAGTTLVDESGGFVKNVPAPINYAKNGYSIDPLIAAMQSTTAPVFTYPAVSLRTPGITDPDAGRSIFSLWDRTYAASSTQVIFDYTHPLFTKPADGVQYQFVIDRQPGDVSEYKIEIDAPLGYVFAENGLASWTYDSASAAATGGMPGQFIVTLTLQKI